MKTLRLIFAVFLLIAPLAAQQDGYAFPKSGIGLTMFLSPGSNATTGSIVTWGGGYLTMTANSTNYVYLDPASGQPAVNTTGFPGSSVPLATVVTGVDAIKTITDSRVTFPGVGGGGIPVSQATPTPMYLYSANGAAGTWLQPSSSQLSDAANLVLYNANPAPFINRVTAVGFSKGTASSATTGILNGANNEVIVAGGKSGGGECQISVNTSNRWAHSCPGDFPAGFSLFANAFDITETAAPANPAAGNDRIYTDLTSHTLTCLKSDGTSCMPATGANTALSNLAAVSINSALLFQTGIDVGSAANAARELYLYGTGTFGTTSIKITGAPTGNRVYAFPTTDCTGTCTFAISSSTSGQSPTFNNVTVATTGSLTYNAGAGTNNILVSGTAGATNGGGLTIAAASQTNGTASGLAGPLALQGGDSASSAGAKAANASIRPGGGSNATPIPPGYLQIIQTYIKGVTVTANNVQCFSGDYTVTDCGTAVTNQLGVAITTANPIQVQIDGLVTVNYDATVSPSAGWFACTSATVAGKVTAQAGACAAGRQVGTVAKAGTSVTSGDIQLQFK